jgi:integrase
MVKTSTPGIYKRGSRYVIVWRDRGKQHKESFRTMAEAREAKGKRATGETQPASNARFDDYARKWLETYNGRENEGLAPSTRESYTRAIEKHAIPYFRGQRLKDLRRQDIEGFARHMQQAGVKPSSVNKHLQAVKALLGTAAIHGDIPASPAAGIRRKADHSARKVKVMTRAQLGVVLAALPVEWQPFFTFLGQTGLRISEATGLLWENVDLGTHAHVKVRRQFYKGTERELKTAHSIRDVPLAPGMRDTLLALRGRRYAGPLAPVWATTRGTPLDAHNLRARVLRPTVAELGLPWIGFHTFRHTCASLLFAGGKDVKQVQEWLGHGDPGFTLRCYVHLMDEGLGSADFLDAQVAPTKGNAVATQHPQAATNTPAAS